MDTPIYENFRQRSRFGSLDGLRCISILLVLLSHTVATSYPLMDSWHLGLGGVRLFFAISGFLITTLLLRERETTGTISLRGFVVRRTLRIFPLYYTVLLVYIALTWLTARHDEVGRQFFHNLPFFITYTTNWFVNPEAGGGADRVLFFFAWTLATEEQFYFFWPTAEKLLGEARAAIAMIGLCLFVLAFKLGAFDAIVPQTGFARMFLGSISLSICLGVLSAHALHSRTGFAVLAKIWTPLNGLLGLIVLLAMMVFWHSEIATSFVSVFVVLSCVQAERHALTPILKWKPIAAFGVVSYGIYLMHLLCNHAVKIITGHLHVPEAGAGPWVRFALTVALVFGVATLSFRYYESFFLRMKSRFEPRREKQLSSITLAGSGSRP